MESSSWPGGVASQGRGQSASLGYAGILGIHLKKPVLPALGVILSLLCQEEEAEEVSGSRDG